MTSRPDASSQVPNKPQPGLSPIARFFDSDLWYSFTRSWFTMIAAAVTLLLILSALLAPWIAPNNPFDLQTVSLLDGS